MREIKFRAWVKKDYYGHGIADYMEGDASCFNNPFEEHEDGNIILMQYTGLKDKHGVEIYEGDIIRSDKDSPIGTVVTAKVYWKGAGFALLTTRGSDTTSAYLELLSPFCEVIGNVHKHPHLLKGE